MALTTRSFTARPQSAGRSTIRDFGHIVSAAAPRLIQVAVKFHL